MKKLILFLFLFSGLAVKAQTNGEIRAISQQSVLPGNGLTSRASGGNIFIDASDNASEQKVRILNAGSIVGIRRAINFIAGTNVSFTMADNSGSDRVDITINASGAGGGGATNLGNTPSASDVALTSSSGAGTTLPAATTSLAGVMTAANRVKLDSAYTHRVALNDSVTRYYRADGSIAYDDTAKAFAFTGSLSGSASSASLVNDNASPGGNFHYGTNSGGTKGFFADAAVAATGKTLTINNSITLQGTDATTMTFPSTSATLARTDAGQTFTGVQLNQLTAGEQGLIPAIQYAILASDFTLTAASGAQNAFATDRDTWTLEAGVTYEIEGNYILTLGTTTTRTTEILFAGTATMTAAALNVTGWNSVPGTTATAQNTTTMTALTSTVVTATATTGGVGIYYKGVITVNAGGTFIPQINFSANPGGTNLMKRGSYIKITRIGSTTIQGAVN